MDVLEVFEVVVVVYMCLWIVLGGGRVDQDDNFKIIVYH